MPGIPLPLLGEYEPYLKEPVIRLRGYWTVTAVSVAPYTATFLLSSRAPSLRASAPRVRAFGFRLTARVQVVPYEPHTAGDPV